MMDNLEGMGLTREEIATLQDIAKRSPILALYGASVVAASRAAKLIGSWDQLTDELIDERRELWEKLAVSESEIDDSMLETLRAIAEVAGASKEWLVAFDRVVQGDDENDLAVFRDFINGIQ